MLRCLEVKKYSYLRIFLFLWCLGFIILTLAYRPLNLLVSDADVTGYRMDFPSAAQTEIYIDLWKRKLYLTEDGKVMKHYSIAPGKIESPSPIGEFKIVNMQMNWGSGFGTRWLGLNVPWGTYGIHGTNKPHLIGQTVSRGCIRMHNKDVEDLYQRVHVGTVVRIEGPIMGSVDLEYRCLARGSRGALVQLVQNRLRAGGYYKGITHGIYDRYTEMAVKTFQKKNHLFVSGCIGYKEMLALGIIE